MTCNSDETVPIFPYHGFGFFGFCFLALNAFYSLASFMNYVAYVKRLKLFPLHSFWMAPVIFRIYLYFRQSKNVIVVVLDTR